MELKVLFNIIIALVSLVALMVLYIKILIDRENIKELSKDKDYATGSWHGGTFFANPNLYLDEVLDNEELNRLIRSQNKKAKLLYINFVLSIIISVIINSVF